MVPKRPRSASPSASRKSLRTAVSRKKRRSTSARLSNDLRDRTSVTGTPRAEADEKNDRILIEDSSARSKASGGNTVTLSLLRARSRIVFAHCCTLCGTAPPGPARATWDLVQGKKGTATDRKIRVSGKGGATRIISGGERTSKKK